MEEAGGKVTDTVGRPLDFSLGAKLDDQAQRKKTTMEITSFNIYILTR